MTEHLTDDEIAASPCTPHRGAQTLAEIGRRVTAGPRKRPAVPGSQTMRRRIRTLGLLVPVVLVAGALTGCDLATGGTASVTQDYVGGDFPLAINTLHFDAVSGMNNSITVSVGTQGLYGYPSSLLLSDAHHVVAAGSGCTRVTLNTVRCDQTTLSMGFSGQDIRLGDGNDTFASSAAGSGPLRVVFATVHAGAGDDTVNGGAGDDVFYEDSDGFDHDSFSGGAGTDAIDYFGVMHAVNISLNDVADDGRAGEGDNVKSDIETIFGSGNADTLTGDDDRNVISALGFDDRSVNLDQLTGGVVIDGGGGDDSIIGTNWGNPDDRLSGGTGNDFVEGYAGDDVISGGAGDDYLRGWAGFDALDGGTETDYCDLGPDGGTTVNCETGP
jgi:Ca2+-binding RTX toxin-like protein